MTGAQVLGFSGSRVLGALFFVGVTALCVASCSRPWIVKPAGKIGAVTFSFHDWTQEPIKPKVVDLEVGEYRGTEGWTTVWRLMGGKRLKAIEYGQTYSGLKEVAIAQPLFIGRSYRVSVRGEFRMGPGGSAAAYFTIGEAGEVLATGPPK